MNIKHLLVAATLCGATVGCTDEEVGKESPLQGQPGEIQLVFSGSGESVEYPTKAIALPSENAIDRMDIFIFGAATMSANSSDWHYIETWSTVDGATNHFQVQNSGTTSKAFIKPNELKGLPYLKLFCVANLPDGKIYKTDGTDADVLKQPTFDADGNMTDGGSLVTNFISTYSAKLLNADDPSAVPLKTPLIMQGNNTTKISGSTSVVSIELRRLAARFDIDNTAAKSQLTIESISIANARSNAPLFDGALPIFTGSDRDNLILYAENDYTKLTNPNNGMTESALYAYPNLPSDSCYLVIKGKFRDSDGSQTPVTYPIHITRTDYTNPASPKTEYIQIMPNNRYKLHISEVTNSSMGGYFEIDNWSNTGVVIDKPQNRAPEFHGSKSLGMINKGEEDQVPVQITPDDSTTLRVTQNKGHFDMMLLSSGETEIEISSLTKAGSSWLVDSSYVYRSDTVPGMIATIVSFTYDNAEGKEPVELTLRNTAADWDPALWTKVVIYGPVVSPELSDAGGHSEGNSIEMDKAISGGGTMNYANMYNVPGSQVLVDLRSIEGVKFNTYSGIDITPVKENGYTTTYAIQIADTTQARTTISADAKIVFSNKMATANETDTVISIQLLDPAITFEKTADAKNAISISDNTIEVDTDVLSDGSFTIKVSSSLAPTLPDDLECPWLQIEKAPGDWTAGSQEYVEYTLSNASGVTGATDTSDFSLIFANKLKNGPGLTIVLKKK